MKLIIQASGLLTYVQVMVRLQIDVFWVVTPCSVVVGYRRFRGPPS